MRLRRRSSAAAARCRRADARSACRRAPPLIDRRQHGDVGAGELAGELQRRVGLHDRPRVDERVRHVEPIRALDEERTLLRIEQREPFVGRDLRRVGFDLREVGPHRAVQHEVAAERPAHVAAELRRGRVVPRVHRRRTARRSIHRVRRLRIHLDDLSVSHAGEIGQRARLRDERRRRSLGRRPRLLVAVVLHVAVDLQSPPLRRPQRIAQAAERNPDLDFVARFGDAAVRLPRRSRRSDRSVRARRSSRE